MILSQAVRLRISSGTHRLASRACIAIRTTTSSGLPNTAQMAGVIAVLQAKEDKYDGIIIEPSALHGHDAASFSQALRSSIQAWAYAGKKGIWLSIPLAAVHLVEPAVKQQFTPHHANDKEITLTRWLSDTPCTLPPSASHQVGVGAFVVNSKEEVLVVQERHGPLRGQNVWKMPTGLIHAGEDLHIGAEREVLEETGIKATFQCVLAMRQAHGFSFGVSDLFVVVGLRLEAGQEDVEPVPQESEVEAVKWMPIDEYLNQPFLKTMTLYNTLGARCAAYARGQYAGWKGAKLDASFTGKRSDLLLWGDDSDDNSKCVHGVGVGAASSAPPSHL